VFIDFAHTPDGLKKALTALKAICHGRLICVFGCGGNRDRGKRPLMGEIAGRLTDFSVLTSDNPRYEEPYSIISAIEGGYCRYSNRYVVVQDRRKAIEYAVRLLREGDVLLIAGKGGEKYQEIMGIKYDYDEAVVVRDIIQKIEAE
jgi:UDP-N-acetylmuramoyl-L-alanyl-D-glutamate--2,6-diaminopimelate ligase